MELCELICILSMVIKVPPSSENLACSYCTNVDGLSAECAQDPINCWQLTSKELLYCLTTFEFRKTVALKTRRCVEHSLFPIDLQILKQMINYDDCSFKTAHNCNCTTCALASSKKSDQDSKNYYENAISDNSIKPMIKNNTNNVKKLSKKKAKKFNLELQRKNSNDRKKLFVVTLLLTYFLIIY